VLWLVYQELCTGIISALSVTLIEAVLLDEGFKLDLYTRKVQSGSMATRESFVLTFIIEIMYFECHSINLMIKAQKYARVVGYLMCDLRIIYITYSASRINNPTITWRIEKVQSTGFRKLL
jgi:hypothetical protein